MTRVVRNPHPDQWSEWYAFVEANPERSPCDRGAYAGLKQAAASRRLTTCQLAPFTHGQPASAPENAIQRIERVHSGAPDGSPATTLPDIARQRDWGELKACASVLDAWIATLQPQLTSLPDAPNGAPTHTRGFVMADDFCEAIHPDATAPHLQVTDVLDRALHRFVAPVGPEVGHA